MSDCGGKCDSCKSHGGCENEKLTQKMSLIKHKILVMSGKGGVGKSTVAAALALALAEKGKKVALLDVDFHGPSQPTLFGIQAMRPDTDGDEFLPVRTAGIGIFSIGCVMDDPDKAVIWRGPAKMSVLKQLLEEVKWGELDYLVFDFPPGTGDEALSACQLVPGEKEAVVVTTPQEVSLADCRKCLDFCAQLKVKVAGIVENMSGFVCPDCGHRHDIFSSGGGQRLADGAGVPLLAQLPLEPTFLKDCDAGDIAGGFAKSGEIRKALLSAADKL